jgi:hypothetical protein
VSRVIQRRDGKHGARYREWSNMLDRYTTRPLTRKQMAQKLVEDDSPAAAVEERLARVDRKGTSCHVGSPEPFDGPWNTERKA